jgi:hypothetical protein
VNPLRAWASTVAEWPDRCVHRLLYRRNPALLARYRHRRLLGRHLDLEHPVRLDEKLAWLMLYERDPLKSTCSDKVAMRDYATEHGYGGLLPELYGIYESVDELDFGALPQSFVLKCSHGSHFNVICPDKSRLDERDARRRIAAWMKQDFSMQCGEVHYAGIEPRILCERYLGKPDGSLPRDFKLHCFHGRVEFTLVCSDRSLDGRAGRYDHYDRPWKNKLALSKTGIQAEHEVPVPASYATMIEAAESLARPFRYVRVDFFEIEGAPILGEMTFTPAACTDTGYTDEAQAMGELLRLPTDASETSSSSPT